MPSSGRKVARASVTEGASETENRQGVKDTLLSSVNKNHRHRRRRLICA